MNFSFASKNILVTGSTRGIGKSIADNFLKSGAKVCYTSRGPGADFSNKSIDENMLYFGCDFTRVNEVSELGLFIEKQWGSLDVLVCNVGSGRSVPDIVSSQEQFEKIFNLNFFAATNAVREFLPLIEKSKGCIIFVSSICGIELINGAPIDYSVSKSALQFFSKSLSKKVAAKGVRVNCLSPGNIIFPGGSWDEKRTNNPAGVDSLIMNTVPMQRFGTPDEVANACLFLCSNYASFITGINLVVDGGQTSSI